MADIVHGIVKLSENTYGIYIRDGRRSAYRRSQSFVAPGVFSLSQKRWWKGGIAPSKDSQRQRCYDAEHSIRGEISQRTFTTTREVATYLRNVMESDWFQRRFPNFFYLRIEFQPGTSNARACPTEHLMWRGEQVASRGWIGFSSWARGTRGEHGGELIMLHELAHAILPRGHKHDRRWARTFIELVSHFMGKIVGDKLKAAMRAKGVKFAPVKTISPERRAAMAVLLAGARKLRGGLAVAACIQSGSDTSSTTESSACQSSVVSPASPCASSSGLS